MGDRLLMEVGRGVLMCFAAFGWGIDALAERLPLFHEQVYPSPVCKEVEQDRGCVAHLHVHGKRLTAHSPGGLLRWFGFSAYYGVVHTDRTPAEARRWGESCQALPATALTLRYARDFAAEDFVNSSKKLLMKRFGTEKFSEFEPMWSKINQLYAPVVAGDEYTIFRDEQGGLALFLNGKKRGVLPPSEFSCAYLQMWLSPEGGISTSFAKKLL